MKKNRIICDHIDCINNPDNYNKCYSTDGNLIICDKCLMNEITESSIDELMEIHAAIAESLDNATVIEDILALPFSLEDIIDDLMASDNVKDVAAAIKDKWTDRFNIILKHKLISEK